MPFYRAPPVYIDEVPSGPRTIEGIARSTAAFVGATVGPIKDEGGEHPASPVLVNSFAEFVQAFGEAPAEPTMARHLAHAVRLYFENGGLRCFIARVGPSAAGDTPSAEDFIGRDDGSGHRSGLCALEDIPGALTIAAPGCTDVSVQSALIAQCERRRDRFALLDGESASTRAPGLQPIIAHRGDHDTSFAAYYVPWLTITHQGRTLNVPPSGAVAGVMARVEAQRGVSAAPANEIVQGVDGLDETLTSSDQHELNPHGINTIRAFPGRGIRVWGARTLAHDPLWKYINVRRFITYLELSIERGTQWVVFEPNDASTWAAVVAAIQAFLLGQWRNGSLQGQSPDEAFFVRCDRTTMTQNDLDNGRLICEIGIAVLRPAEFVIFRIGQWTADAK